MIDPSTISREPDLDEIVRRVVDAVAPERIVLFGSRVAGTQGGDSDVDLMVEVDVEHPGRGQREQAGRVDSALMPRTWGLDVLVYTPAEVRRLQGKRYSMVREIERTGRTLYERPR